MATVTPGRDSSKSNGSLKTGPPIQSESAVEAQKPTPAIGSQAVAKGLLSKLMGAQVLATGSYAPETVVRNEDLAELGCDSEWIIQRTGILERRRAEPGMTTSEMALRASLPCLERTNTQPEELDLIIVCTMTPDCPTPATSCNLQRKLGAIAPAMDLNAACSGFMYGMVTGMQFINSGACQRVLVVGVDMMTRTVNPADKKTFPLFGDGAGAVLLGKSGADQGLLSYMLGAEGDGGELLSQPGGGTAEPITPELLKTGRQFVQMDGRAVFKWAVRRVADASLQVLQHADMSVDDVDLVVLHQANIRIIDSAIQSLGVDPDKVLVNLDRYGNTSAGSIPLVLDEAFQQGRLRRGDRVLITGFGAGLSWGAGVLRW